LSQPARVAAWARNPPIQASIRGRINTPNTGERNYTRNILLRNDFFLKESDDIQKKPNLNESLIKKNQIKPILISEGKKYEKSKS
jgi:hypothetical protein